MARGKNLKKRIETMFSEAEEPAPGEDARISPQLFDPFDAALRVSRELADVRDLPTLLQQTTESITTYFHLRSCAAYLAGPEMLHLRAAYSHAEVHTYQEELAAGGGALAAQALRQKQGVIGEVQPDGMFSLALPLLAGDEQVGVLVLQSAPGGLSSQARAALELFSSWLALAVRDLRRVAHRLNQEQKDKEGAADLDRTGWDQYLDAIHEKERIGYSFDQTDVLPISNPLPQVHQTSVMDSGTEKTLLVAPLVLGEQTIGSLQLERSNAQPWTDQEAGVVDSVARQVAQHLENLRLLAQAERYRQEAEGAVRRLTREGWETYLDPTRTPFSGYTYDQEMVRPFDGETDNGGTEQKTAPGAIEAARHDIRVRDETIGELTVEDFAEDEDDASELVAAVAERLSLHIEALRLLEQTEISRQQLDKRAAELETVASVSTAAATILEPDVLLQTVVDLAQRRFGLYQAQVHLLQDDLLVRQASAGVTENVQSAADDYVWLSIETDVVAQAARLRRPVLIPDIANEPVYQAQESAPLARSQISVPLLIGDQLIGVMSVSSETPNYFSEDDVRTYITLATQTAVALRNAELYAEQMRTVERLRELDILKSSFLANMSHELRTPLNSILGFTQVMLEGIDGPLTENMLFDLDLIEKNGRHLLELINSILDMAKIEAGRMNLIFEPFDLRALLADVINTAGPLARNKSIYLSLDIYEELNLNIVADEIRIRQTMLNLISNAIKFTPSGGVNVTVERQQSSFLIKVHDTGIGIPPNQLEMIFEAFSQVDSSTTRQSGGTGLGLPISRRLAEMHGGRLWAESSGIAGEGSTFFLELPIQARMKA